MTSCYKYGGKTLFLMISVNSTDIDTFKYDKLHEISRSPNVEY